MTKANESVQEFFLFTPVGYEVYRGRDGLAVRAWQSSTHRKRRRQKMLVFSPLSLLSPFTFEYWSLRMVMNTLSLGFPSSTNLCRNTLSMHSQCAKSRQVSHEAPKPQCHSQILSAYSCISLPFVSSHRTIISRLVHELNHIRRVQMRLCGFWKSLSTFHPKPGGPCCKYIKI